MSSVTRARLPDREGSGAAMSTMALNPLGGLQGTTCPITPDPASLLGGLWVATRPTVPCGPQASSIKKSLAGLPVLQGSPVPNTRAHVSMAPNNRSLIGLQDMWAGTAVHAYKMCGQVATVWL
jgi:hypothetical protein